MGPDQFDEYYQRWYVAANMTVIGVGDIDPATLVAAIGRHFGAAPRRGPARADSGGGVAERGHARHRRHRSRARSRRCLADPDRAGAAAGHDGGCLPTRARRRARAVDARPAARGGPRRRASRLRECRGRRESVGQRGATGDPRVTAAPDRWRPALTDLIAATQQARLYGFTGAEVEEARAAFLARAEQEAQQEPTRPARQLLGRINAAVSRREPIVAAAGRLSLHRRLLAGITAEEVSNAFRADFDPGNSIFVLTLPASAAAPSETELAGLGRAALDLRPAAPVARAAPPALLAAPLPGGTVVEERVHEATGVWSGWLDNGVRVHHRKVEQRQGEAAVIVTLAGGEIEEGSDTRGVTQAAMEPGSGRRPAGLSSTDIRTLMTGKKVRVRGWSGPDTVTLAVSGDPAALETGLELAYVMLTDPVVEPGGLCPVARRQAAGDRRACSRAARRPRRGPGRSLLPGQRGPPATGDGGPGREPDPRGDCRPGCEAWWRARPSRSPWSATSTGTGRARSSRAPWVRSHRARGSTTRRSAICARCRGRSVLCACERVVPPGPTRPRCSTASSRATCSRSETAGSSSWPRACSPPG